MTSKSWVFVSVGRCVQTPAAAPETSGAEKLVPSYVSHGGPDLAKVCGIATGMFWPGAARSMSADAVEKYVTRFDWSVAPIVSTCAKEAGYDGGLPSCRPFPAEATTSEPEPKADRIACSSIGSRSPPPRLRLITPGPWAIAEESPAISSPTVSTPDGLASQTCSFACG